MPPFASGAPCGRRRWNDEARECGAIGGTTSESRRRNGGWVRGAGMDQEGRYAVMAVQGAPIVPQEWSDDSSR